VFVAGCATHLRLDAPQTQASISSNELTAKTLEKEGNWSEAAASCRALASMHPDSEGNAAGVFQRDAGAK